MDKPSSSYTSVWTSAGECVNGVLEFNIDEVSVLLDSGEKLVGTMNDSISYSADQEILVGPDGKQIYRELKTGIKVRLKPLVIELRHYNPKSASMIEDVYPPSSEGLYSKLKTGTEAALYIVQEILQEPALWLTIVQPRTGEILQAHRIQPYEVDFIRMVEDIENDPFMNRTSDTDFLAILDAPAPNWEQAAKVVDDISIPNLKLGKTMKEFTSQLVPQTFPHEIRQQLMAFLSYVTMGEIVIDDPVEYFDELDSLPVLRNLLMGHVRCIVDNEQWPTYVKLLHLAGSKHLQAQKRPLQEPHQDTPWALFWYTLYELFPDWKSVAIEAARKLNESSKIVLGLPITRSKASRSKKAWKDRLAMFQSGLMLRSDVKPPALGLHQFAYLGSAYKWVHRHMSWATRLGPMSDNTPHLQVMVVPPRAAERIRRFLPNAVEIVWSHRSLNTHLFDTQLNNWTVPIKKIHDSMEKASSFKELSKSFGISKFVEPHNLTHDEAKVLDFTSFGVPLATLEHKECPNMVGMPIPRMRSILTKLRDGGVTVLNYELILPFMSIATVVQGPSSKVASLASSLLHNTPTSFAMIGENSDFGIVISRIPDDKVHEFVSSLPKRGVESDLLVRCMIPRGVRGYRRDLYQRLLKSDGTWDDDVSAFLSQARSKRKELSESNA